MSNFENFKSQHQNVLEPVEVPVCLGLPIQDLIKIAHVNSCKNKNNILLDSAKVDFGVIRYLPL